MGVHNKSCWGPVRKICIKFLANVNLFKITKNVLLPSCRGDLQNFNGPVWNRIKTGLGKSSIFKSRGNRRLKLSWSCNGTKLRFTSWQSSLHLSGQDLWMFKLVGHLSLITSSQSFTKAVHLNLLLFMVSIPLLFTLHIIILSSLTF